MSATINLEKKHFPVLLDELIKIISPRYSGTFLDCTFGQGGYSKKILENFGLQEEGSFELFDDNNETQNTLSEEVKEPEEDELEIPAFLRRQKN